MLETKKVSEEPTLPLLVLFVRSFLRALCGLKFFLHSVYPKAFLTTMNTMRIAHKGLGGAKYSTLGARCGYSPMRFNPLIRTICLS